MIKTKLTWEIGGIKREEERQVNNLDHAWSMAEKFFNNIKEAYCITLTEFQNHSFVIRVMSKEKILYKIQTVAA